MRFVELERAWTAETSKALDAQQEGVRAEEDGLELEAATAIVRKP